MAHPKPSEIGSAIERELPPQCVAAIENFRAFAEGSLSMNEGKKLESHLASCASCQQEFEHSRQLYAVMDDTFGARRIAGDFDARAQQALKQTPADPAALREEAAALAANVDEEGAVLAAVGESRFSALSGVPWWGVSVVLHGLVILLAGLISMAISLPPGEEPMVTVTELAQRPPVVAAEKQKEKLENALHSKKETPPTDPASKDAMDVIVPPELLAKAELSDHFETINPDRPDTHSAFGNPDAQMFHSAQGSDEPEGGGGNEGLTLEDMIGVGGAASPGSGGGWGGGIGSGIGVGTGSGHGSFGGRGGGRALLVKRNGGSPATENAVNRALDWLARHQEADGSWNVMNTNGQAECKGCDPGVTGLALLAFLGAGHTEKIGKYRENVRKAVAWIISQQGKDGGIGAKYYEPSHGNYAYIHAICGMALAEAAGMANIKETHEAAQRAVDYSTQIHQCGEGSDKLGWRYKSKAAQGDVSVSGWFIMQLKSAKVAGLHIDPASFEGALKFLSTREADPAKVKKEDEAYDNGRFRYGYTNDRPFVNTTAIGMLCQIFCGTKVEEMRGAAMWLLRTNPPEWKAELAKGMGGYWPMYYTYYTTLTMFQMGGDQWKQWNQGMQKMLLPNQNKGGDADGSWDGLGGYEKSAGRTYTTALGCMSLEVYYRYARLNPNAR